jgi:hypothetical protein
MQRLGGSPGRVGELGNSAVVMSFHETSDRRYRSHPNRRARSAMSYIGLSVPNRIPGLH